MARAKITLARDVQYIIKYKIQILFNSSKGIIIHPKWEMDEKAKSFRKDISPYPPIAPTIPLIRTPI